MEGWWRKRLFYLCNHNMHSLDEEGSKRSTFRPISFFAINSARTTMKILFRVLLHLPYFSPFSFIMEISTRALHRFDLWARKRAKKLKLPQLSDSWPRRPRIDRSSSSNQQTDLRNTSRPRFFREIPAEKFDDEVNGQSITLDFRRMKKEKKNNGFFFFSRMKIYY